MLVFFGVQVPPSLRGMISRSFATQDAHDQIRAAVVNLFEVMQVDPTVDVNEVGAIDAGGPQRDGKPSRRSRCHRDGCWRVELLEGCSSSDYLAADAPL